MVIVFVEPQGDQLPACAPQADQQLLALWDFHKFHLKDQSRVGRNSYKFVKGRDMNITLETF